MSLQRVLRHAFTSRRRAVVVLPPAALDRITATIAQAEARHAGQIRFALEHALEPLQAWRGESARERALEVFSLLRVWDTEHNNGVLVYLLLADRDVEIVADRGIDAKVGAAAWEAICHEMEAAFRAGKFEQGVTGGIARISALLETHFPRRAASPNELPDRPVVL